MRLSYLYQEADAYLFSTNFKSMALVVKLLYILNVNALKYKLTILLNHDMAIVVLFSSVYVNTIHVIYEIHCREFGMILQQLHFFCRKYMILDSTDI